MKANLLIVSAGDFPGHISAYLEERGFTCSFSRGRIKTKEILNSEIIDTVVWLYQEDEAALAEDLLAIFNQYPAIPIVFVTQSYDELDFAEDIQGLFANLDLNDDLEDFLRTVELASNITPTDDRAESDTKEDKTLPEIDFKNVVAHIIEGDDPASNKNDAVTQNISTWNAVDQAEREILSKPLPTGKKPPFGRVKKWFNR